MSSKYLHKWKFTYFNVNDILHFVNGIKPLQFYLSDISYKLGWGRERSHSYGVVQSFDYSNKECMK